MCTICNHKNRSDIENAILNIASDTGVTLEKIAEHYELSLDELKTHALFHTPLSVPGEAVASEVDPVSLVRKMKLREADILSTVNNEYLVTLKTMGRRINRLAAVSQIDAEDDAKKIELSKLLTKPMVDLYVGVGGEIRQNVKAMAEVDRLLNGPQDNCNSGLESLANAIRGSVSK